MIFRYRDYWYWNWCSIMMIFSDERKKTFWTLVWYFGYGNRNQGSWEITQVSKNAFLCPVIIAPCTKNARPFPFLCLQAALSTWRRARLCAIIAHWMNSIASCRAEPQERNWICDQLGKCVAKFNVTFASLPLQRNKRKNVPNYESLLDLHYSLCHGVKIVKIAGFKRRVELKWNFSAM